jgi:hypothetical protein
VLVILALVSYVPALSGSFVFDDSMYLLEDERVTEVSGLGRIWSEVSGPGYRHQYYPLTSSVWWLQWRLWGDNVVGYHVVNVLLHGLCAVLLWRLLVAVRAPGAWLAGLLFVLHPLHVTSVAWISELKNVLSCALMLGSLVVFCRNGGQWRPLLGWTLFIGALMSKTATASLPVALALLVYYRDGRISGRWWGRLGLLSLTGLCAVGLTSYLEWLHRAGGEAFALDLGERIRVASAAVWFYAAKLAFPWGLSFVYPRWDPMSWPWWTWLYPASLVVTLGGLWAFRHRISRGPLCAVVFFVIAVAPVSLANVAYTRHSYVADHWAYWGSLGLAALAAGLMVRGSMALARARWVVPAGAVTAAVMVSVLGAMTWQRAGIFESPRALWSDTVRRNPASALARNGLGDALMQSGDLDGAVVHLRQATLLDPSYPDAHYNLANALKGPTTTSARRSWPSVGSRRRPVTSSGCCSWTRVIAPRATTSASRAPVRVISTPPSRTCAPSWRGTRTSPAPPAPWRGSRAAQPPHRGRIAHGEPGPNSWVPCLARTRVPCFAARRSMSAHPTPRGHGLVGPARAVLRSRRRAAPLP